MFTGLVECMGTVRSVSGGGVIHVGIFAPEITGSLKLGESVSVSGACLTVTEVSGDVFYVQMMPETARVSKLGSFSQGLRVNLERAMRMGDRLDGHIVLGHVDCVGKVMGFEKAGGSAILAVSAPDVSWGLAPKGSVAIDGVSLTVVDSSDDFFTVGLIPTTLRETTIGLLAEGGAVNVEIDVIARYVARLLRNGSNENGHAKNSLTWEKLGEYGWV